jgi:hypothetical protein
MPIATGKVIEIGAISLQFDHVDGCITKHRLPQEGMI